MADLADGLPEGELFGLLLSYPGASGAVRDPSALIEAAHERGALVAVAADLLALTLLTPPGELGADAVVGTTQRFGVPLGYGGPHAGYLSVRQKLARQLPGGSSACPATPTETPPCGSRCRPGSSTSAGRRRRATSARRRCCSPSSPRATPSTTDRTDCAGSRGGRTAWRRCWRRACAQAGSRSCTTRSSTPSSPGCRAERTRWSPPRTTGASRCGGSTRTRSGSPAPRSRRGHLSAVWAAFGVAGQDVDALDAATPDALPAELARQSEYLTHPVFAEHRSETSLMRWLRRLADADLALDRTMIPLGSCTMKLNAAAEMEPVTWPAFADLHPFAPAPDAAGTLALIADLERWLAEAHRLRRGVAAAQRGQPGRARGPARDRRLRGCRRSGRPCRRPAARRSAGRRRAPPWRRAAAPRAGARRSPRARGRPARSGTRHGARPTRRPGDRRWRAGGGTRTRPSGGPSEGRRPGPPTLPRWGRARPLGISHR